MNNNHYIVGILSLIALMSCVAAQSSTSTTSYWHDADYYAIQLDGAGNGFVAAQMNLESISARPVEYITLDIPYSNVTVYRVVGENSIYYSPCYGSIDCVASYPYYNYGDPEFLNYTVTNYGNMTALTVHLNTPLTNSSQTRLYFFFSTRNLASKMAGVYSFEFKTITDPYALIRNAYANVEVPQDMYLKGKSSFAINYGTVSPLDSVSAAGSAKSLVSNVQQSFYGPYQYSATNLLPFEYFTITGTYGSSILVLYLPEILFANAVIAVVAALAIRYSMISKAMSLFRLKSQSGKRKRSKTGISFSRAAISGGVSGFLFQLAYFAMSALYYIVNGGNSYYSYNSPLPILLALLSLVVYAFALFGLPYFMSYRHDKREGILAGVISIAASILFYLIIMLLLMPPIVYARPMG
jgi:hypothetical protein